MEENTHQQQQGRRRGSRGKGRGRGTDTPCARELCRRQTHTDHRTCSLLCELVLTEIEQAQRVFAATGDRTVVSSAEALSVMLTAHHGHQGWMLKNATAVGITPDQWGQIQRGAA